MEVSVLPSDVAPFRCEVRPERQAVRVCPIGELDMATVPVVDTHLGEQQPAGVKHLTLDLRDVSFLDSTGLRMILDWDAMSRADGFAFSLVAGPPTVQRIFEITGTNERLTFVEAATPAASSTRRVAPRASRYAEGA
jgi:anti-sigma B factor antagonist